MKVFLSFSQKDHKVAHKLAGTLLVAGMTPLIATEKRKLGEKLNKKVKKLIEESDCFVAVLTGYGVQSKWVQQEIGAAIALDKHIVPLKTRNAKLPAMLDTGIEHYTFTKSSPEHDFAIVADCLCDFADEKKLKLRKTKRHKELKDFEIIHLPQSVICSKCKKVEIHIWLCKICGEWLCVDCGSPISRQKQS